MNTKIETKPYHILFISSLQYFRTSILGISGRSGEMSSSSDSTRALRSSTLYLGSLDDAARNTFSSCGSQAQTLSLCALRASCCFRFSILALAHTIRSLRGLVLRRRSTVRWLVTNRWPAECRDVRVVLPTKYDIVTRWFKFLKYGSYYCKQSV